MLRLFRALFARIKAMFAADAALEIQAEMAARSAERKAQLYRLAARYDEEGLASVAHDLRRQAESLHHLHSVDDVVPSVAELMNEQPLEDLPGASNQELPSPAPATVASGSSAKSIATRPRKR